MYLLLKKLFFIFLTFFITISFFLTLVFSYTTFIDEDGESMIDTKDGFNIRENHPRILVSSQEELDMIVDRMYGVNAREPYSIWFNDLLDKLSDGESIGGMNLALVYLATGNQTYKDQIINSLNSNSGDISKGELYLVDLFFDDISDELKLKYLRRASENEFHYNSLAVSRGTATERWGYHAFHETPIIFSSIFAYTPILNHTDIKDNPSNYLFNVTNYLNISYRAYSPGGKMWESERRVGGDMNFRDGLQGDYGGMYDNFGYDQSEEKMSIYAIAALSFLTKEPIYEDFLRDKYKGRFYQMMYYPHTRNENEGNSYCQQDGAFKQRQAMIWNTQSGISVSQPDRNTIPLRSRIYNDPKINYFNDYGASTFHCTGARYNSLYMKLLYYNDSLEVDFPSSNPTSMYFSGPGFVSTRSSWNDSNSLFNVFISGTGISRRYTDGNSFLLSRKSDLIMHSGTRTRYTYINNRHFWFTQQSAAKNTLKIMDPNECLDSNRADICSGVPLFDTENLGGQVMSVTKSENEFDYDTYGSSTGQSGSTGVINKYEFEEGKYSYSQGDATRAYTKKIDFYERENVFLYPDRVIIFDRVKSINSSFKKLWTIHTGPKPNPVGEIISTEDFGYRGYGNITRTIFKNDVDKMVIDSIYPINNKAHVRGGHVVHLNNRSLEIGEKINSLNINMDIPRWVEVLAIGNIIEGTLEITGDTKDSVGVTEIIEFDGTTKSYQSGRPNTLQGNYITDPEKSWEEDEWKGYMVYTSGQKNYATITGNDENTLYVDNLENLGGEWRYRIIKPLSNSVNEWIKIDSIESIDMNLSEIIIRTPHHFDTKSANGNLYSFSPSTTGPNSGAMRNNPKHLGNWVFELESNEPKLLDNFFNVITVRDPNQDVFSRYLLETDEILGSVIDNDILFFKKDVGEISNISIDILTNGTFNIYNFNLIPNTTYYYNIENSIFELSTESISSFSIESSAMGSIVLDDIIFESQLSLPEINFSSNQTNIMEGDSIEINWIVSSASFCSASGNWSGNKPLEGSQVFNNINKSIILYLECSSNQGSVQKNISINVEPLDNIQDNTDTSSGGGSSGSGSSGGSSGGGGGGSSFTPRNDSPIETDNKSERNFSNSSTADNIIREKSCSSSFSYDSWSSCENGTQSRLRTDRNSCVEPRLMTRSCDLNRDQNEVSIERAKELNLSPVIERYYSSSFESNFEVFKTSEDYGESFLIYNEEEDLDYLALLSDEIEGELYYSMQVVDDNLISSGILEEQGLVEISEDGREKISVGDVFYSRITQQFLYIFFTLTLIFSIFVIHFYVKKHHRLSLQKTPVESSVDTSVMKLKNFISSHPELGEVEAREKLSDLGWDDETLDKVFEK